MIAPAISRVLLASSLLLAASSLGVAHAGTSIVVDVETGHVLSQDRASARWYPASTTKLMTAYVALRAVEAERAALDMPVVMTRDAARQAPSKMDYQPGSVMRLDNALRMLLVKSANDVAVAIGQSLAGGSLEAFVAAMNAEAERLGMRDTRFINPNGLPGPGQYSSAKDLAILASAIRREFPAFTDYFSTEAISTGEATMKNGNGLLGRYRGADGMKTGYICASGFNLVASATRGERTLVAVVLGAQGPIVRERKTAELFENAFKIPPGGARKTVAQLPVSGGAPADISEEICSQAGRTERANERQAKDDTFGSPYMEARGRPLVTVPVVLGGAAGGEGIEPGISVIAAYGIPTPTWRPERPEDALSGSGAISGAPATGSTDVPTTIHSDLRPGTDELPDEAAPSGAN